MRLIIDSLRLRKGYNRLVDGLDLVLSPGEALSLSGENGVGKTTLLRAIAGFAPPDGGTIRFERDGAPLEAEVAQARRIHYLGHHDALSPSRTVAQELRFQADWLGGEVAGLEALNLAALKLAPLMDLDTRYLSAGQKRRLSCARLLLAKRPLWLLDEPMAPLDAGHRDLLAGLMQAHLAQGGSIIAAVHDPLPFATRSLRLTRPQMERADA
ncbi:MAG: heme ABC exporter ATP-binding protein CcmA [Asticcacaulis sp.]|uniref:heme ABC exporter ATP-binding protein CcmA n=1 Tax=Asticcacaulis sp. TaxID=1872648 RepID=UPI003F7BDD32